MDQSIIQRVSKPFWRIAASGRIRFNVPESFGECSELRLFGKTVYRSSSMKEQLVSVEQHAIINAPVMYFKINRLSRYTRRCVQAWVSVAEELGAKYYFVCDNPFLEQFILKKCSFDNPNVQFIPSMRKELKGIVDNFCDNSWRNATYAHLTPFFHARIMGYESFWCIDADDTMFLLESHVLAKALHRVEEIATDQNDSIISLDMHYSRSGGNHWSLGVVYVSGITDFCEVFERVHDKSWTRALDLFGSAANLDWFFTFLKRQENGIVVEQFYIDNAMFIHWGDFMIEPINSAVYSWKTGEVTYGVIALLFGLDGPGVLPIVDSLCIDIGLNGDEGSVYWFENVTSVMSLDDDQRRLWRIDS